MPPTHAVGSRALSGAPPPAVLLSKDDCVVPPTTRRSEGAAAMYSTSAGIAPVAPRSELAEKAEPGRAVLVAAQGVGQVGVDKTQDGGGRLQRRVIRRRLRRGHDESGEGQPGC